MAEPTSNDDAVSTWEFSSSQPADWQDRLVRCDGNFFHSPAALELSLPPGEPVFATRWMKGSVTGVALGIRTRCRLSRSARHYTIASPPAAGDALQAAESLVRALKGAGAAEVVMDSYEAPPELGKFSGETRGELRIEHRVELGAGAEMLKSFDGKHRTQIGRGEREGWELRTLRGKEAREALFAVESMAAERAQKRGNPFAALPMPPESAGRDSECDALWGSRCFSAWNGDQMLGVCLIGWGNGRAYYLLGGSTPEGYRLGAAVWLHWKVMQLLSEAGHTAYNFGGTPASAREVEHPSHGLYRFKSRFGAAHVACRGARWTLRPSHLRAHEMLLAVSRRVRAVKQS